MIESTKFKKNSFIAFNNKSLSIPSFIPIMIFLFLFFSFTAKGFLSLYNIKSILLQSSSLSIIALGISIVMMTNGIDLSIGSTISFISVLLALLLSINIGIVFAIMIVLTTGTIIGLFNGFLISNLRLPPFLITLGTMGIINSLALIITNGLTVYWDKNLINKIANNEILFFPIPFVIAIILLFLIIFLFNYNSLGLYVKGLGNNEESIRLAGIKVNRFKTIAYIICSLFATVSSVITTSRVACGNPTIGFGSEFEAIAAAAVGGISFIGGKGHPGFAFFSAITITLLINGLSLLGLSTAWQYTGIGLLLIIGMYLNIRIINDL